MEDTIWRVFTSFTGAVAALSPTHAIIRLDWPYEYSLAVALEPGISAKLAERLGKGVEIDVRVQWSELGDVYFDAEYLDHSPFDRKPNLLHDERSRREVGAALAEAFKDVDIEEYIREQRT